MNRFYLYIYLSFLSLVLVLSPLQAQEEEGSLPPEPAPAAIEALESGTDDDIPVPETPAANVSEEEAPLTTDGELTDDDLAPVPVEEALQTPAGEVTGDDIAPLPVEEALQTPVGEVTVDDISPAPVAADVSDSATSTPISGTVEVTAAADAGSKDVILVLDNSGSMKKNDPQFLGKQAAVKFIEGLDEATRAAVIIFDQSINLAVPLTDINAANRVMVLQSLDHVNYKGQWTESPAAIERAVYELKTNGRKDAQKFIIFMTDGVVDTGDPAKDLEQAKWLKGELAEDAANSGIKIFGIAYTENADFHLIQAIAQKTSGEYFRALKPEDLQNVFEQVITIVNTIPVPEVVAPPVQVEAPVPPVPIAPPPPVIIEVPVQPQGMDQEEKARSIMILVALTVLILAVIIMVLMLWRGSRRKVVTEDYAQEAYLNDINGYTGQASFKLGNVPAMLGRVAGTDADHLNYIVIPQTTIGRRHALIEYKDFSYWIIDQGSINGTFVNDQMITSETRLKHGDKVRLHKYEFEFIMPEMVDAGATQISRTVMAANPAAAGGDVTVARGGSPADADLPEPVFDLTGGMGGQETDSDEAETLIRGSSGGKKEADELNDETLMQDDDNDALDDADEDATLRPDMDDDSDLTVDNFLDSDKKK